MEIEHERIRKRIRPERKEAVSVRGGKEERQSARELGRRGR